MNSQRTNSARDSKPTYRPTLRLCPAIVLLFLAIPAYAKYGGGSGTQGDPYLIATPEHLYDIGKHEEDWDWGKCFKLVADIDLATYKDVPHIPIGHIDRSRGPEGDRPFNGNFDGDGHTISNFRYHSKLNDAGLFGVIGYDTTVENLGLVDADVSGGGKCRWTYGWGTRPYSQLLRDWKGLGQKRCRGLGGPIRRQDLQLLLWG